MSLAHLNKGLYGKCQECFDVNTKKIRGKQIAMYDTVDRYGNPIKAYYCLICNRDWVRSQQVSVSRGGGKPSPPPTASSK